MATVRDLSLAVFRKLAEGTEIKIEEYPKVRIYLTEVEYDKLASSLQLLSLYVFAKNVCFLLVELEEEHYFLTIGLSEELKHSLFQPIDNLTELSLASIYFSKVERLSTVTETILLETVFTSTSIEDVRWEVVKDYFPLVQTYKLKNTLSPDPEENSVFLKKLSLYALCKHQDLLILDFEPITLDLYIEVSETNNVPLDNLLQSLGSNYWKFCYIDLYRCIERLFVIVWVYKYQYSLQSTLSPLEISNTLKNNLHIEKHEVDNINYLFSFIDSTTLSILDSVKGGMNYDNYIYKLRNKIVHYQSNEAEIGNITTDKWNVIDRFMLSATKELYSKFDSYMSVTSD